LLWNGSFAILVVGPRIVAVFEAGSQYGHYGNVQYLDGVTVPIIVVLAAAVLDNFSYYCSLWKRMQRIEDRRTPIVELSLSLVLHLGSSRIIHLLLRH